jgi:hypothetical protein
MQRYKHPKITMQDLAINGVPINTDEQMNTDVHYETQINADLRRLIKLKIMNLRESALIRVSY